MEGVRWWAKWMRELDRRVEAMETARELGGGAVSGFMMERGRGEGWGAYPPSKATKVAMPLPTKTSSSLRAKNVSVLEQLIVRLDSR